MDEAADAGGCRGGEHRQRSRHIAGFERRRVRRVDDSGDVDHGVALGHQPLERVAVFETALDPFDALRGVLRAPRQRSDLVPTFDCKGD